MKFPDYYPPSPKKIPEDLTEVSAPFRRHVNLMAFSLLIFFVLYFGLIALLSAGIILCVMSRNGLLYLLAVVLLIPLAILVKNLFNRQKVQKGYEVEIDLEDHPRLDRFLQCVCEETGAPMPDRVFINFEVNASAGNEISLVSLVSTPTRVLTLGLGLLNVLNLTEFKALLAHEFGHLSQMSMKSAPHVRLAMQVMSNILCGTKLIGLDRLMQAVFILIVKLHQGLSREMEFHADRVAVSVAGSDAVPQLLFKCLWAEATLQRAVADLEAAQDHGLFSRDVFLHQTMAGNYLRRQAHDKNLGRPPRLSSDRTQTFQLFAPDEEQDQVARMWASHPPNHEREINAKVNYIRTDFDEESPWLLFSDREELCEKVSYQFYRAVFNIRKKKVQWASAETVQKFLDEEYAETIFDMQRYGFLYNNRKLESMDLRALRDQSEETPHAPEDLVASHLTLYTPAVKEFAEVFQRHFQEMALLQAIKNRWYRPSSGRFEMRGQKLRTHQVGGVIKDVDKEIQADIGWLGKFDARVYVTYFQLACLLDKKWAEELYQRYRFHFVIQKMWTVLQQHKSAMNFMFDVLGKMESAILDEGTFHMLIEVFRRAHDAAFEVLEGAKEVVFPQLANMPAGQPVRPFLLDGYLVDRPSHLDLFIKPKWLIKFARQFHDVEKRLSRLHFKSLGNILSLQEAIGQKAEETWPMPVVEVGGRE